VTPDLNTAVGAATGAIVMLLGFGVGVLLSHLHARRPKPKPAICGCGHHLSFHDDSGCHYTAYIEYTNPGVMKTCGCTGYLTG
jgi:hypothetical protein